MRLAGKVCVVTGAAGGIGRATVEAFRREGATVAGVDVADGAPGDLSLRADLTREDDVRAAFDRVVDVCGRVDVVFNNAGISPIEDGSILDTSVETWHRVIDVNLLSVFLGCRVAIPRLLRNDGPRRGSVINAASLVAVMGTATSQIAYTASKGGVLALSRELGVQFAADGLRVNAICPGPVETPLLLDLFRDEPELAQRRMVHVPMGRFAVADEVAACAVFLASDESSYVNATSFMVDGGISAAFVTPAS